MYVGHTGVSHLTTRISFWRSSCVKTWLLCFYLTQLMCHTPAVLIIVEELLTHQMSQIVSEESSFVLAATSGCKGGWLFFGLMTPTWPWLISDSFISYHIWNSADCTPIRYFFCADVIHGGPFSLLTLDVGKLNQVKFNDRLFWREGGENDVWYNPRHLKHQRGNSSGSEVQRHQKRRSMRMIQMIVQNSY